MGLTMLSSISRWITLEKHPALLRLWRSIRPERIVVRDFYPQGCIFDAITPLESYRITSLGLEKDFIAHLLTEIRPGEVFYDIGSCVGLFALHAGILGASVYAFEPDPGFRKRLIHNIRINRLKRQIKVVDWAVSNTNGQLILYTDGIDGNSPSIVTDPKRGSVEVQTKTIDSGIANGELIPPDIIKMDIEGGEFFALQGMQNLFSSPHPPATIYLELHPAMLTQMNASVGDCLALIGPHGYQKRYEETRLGQIHLIFDRKRS